jgi:predicted nucleic acid-binding Zn ribbon protein
MDRLGRSVRDELGRFGPAAGMADLVAVWPDAVGPQIAQNAWPARIARDGTLHVHTTSSAWAFELTHLETTLRERLGDLAPRRLKFAVGPVPEPSGEQPNDAATTVAKPSPEDVADAAALVADIDDENLRNLVARAASLSLAKGRDDR